MQEKLPFTEGLISRSSLSRDFSLTASGMSDTMVRAIFELAETTPLVKPEM